jgi:hypothetical protein
VWELRDGGGGEVAVDGCKVENFWPDPEYCIQIQVRNVNLIF